MNWIFEAYANVYSSAMLSGRPATRNAAIAKGEATRAACRQASSLAGAR